MRVLRILLIVAALATVASAQKAGLSGTVYDANGAVIVGASVSAVDEQGQRHSAKTNDDGVYRLSLPFNLYDPAAKDFRPDKFRVAKYDISASAPYFEATVLRGYKFVPVHGGEVKLDIALDVKAGDPCHDPAACMPVVAIEKNEVLPNAANITVRPALPSVEKQVELYGKVTDLLGVSLQKYGRVKALAKNSQPYYAQTMDDGTYLIRLPVGGYRVEVSSDGFCTVVIREFKISSDSPQRILLDFALPGGATRNAPCVRYKD